MGRHLIVAALAATLLMWGVVASAHHKPTHGGGGATPTIERLTDWLATVEARGCFEPTPVTTATPEQEYPPLNLHLPVCEE